MGSDLGARWPRLLRSLEHDYEFLASQFAPARFAPYRIDWSEGWEAEAQSAIVADHRSLIFGHVSHSAFLSDVARQFGLEPSAVIGYSLGETAGYFASRAWTDRDEMMRRVQGSTLFTEDLVGACKSARAFWGLGDREPLEWRVGVVDRSATQVRQVLKSMERVYLLIVNTPQECVIGGEGRAVGDAVRALGCAFFALQGISTVHCEVAKPVRDSYRGLHLFKMTPPPGMRFYSGAFGRSFDVGRQSAADSIVGQAITGFEFPRVIESAYEDGVRIFLEMGPQASCTRMIGRILGDRPHVARSICLQGQGGYSGVVRFLARMIAERVPVDLAPLFDDRRDALEIAGTGSRLRVPLGGAPDAKPELILAPEPEPEPEPEAEVVEIPQGSDGSEAESDGENQDAAVWMDAESPEPVPVEPAAAAVVDVDFQEGRRDTPAQAPFSHEHTGVTISEDLIASIAAAQAASAAAHATFLQVSQATIESQSRALELQLSLLEALGAEADFGPVDGDGGGAEEPASLPSLEPRAEVNAGPIVLTPPTETPRVFDRARCLEFARGRIVNVLGPAFAEIDRYPTRVRLPDEPLMLVDRITATEGEPGALGPGRLVTEHDVLPGGWYLDGGRMAPGVTIEAGQADLFLCAYLGIDFETKGIGKYRLLDAAVTYHRSLPRPGEVIRYDIRIERFARQGAIHLFFFNYDGTINGEPLMTMRQGCAGFFSDRQLDEGRGLVLSEMEQTPQPGRAPEDWQPPVELKREAYDAEALDALRAGDLARCFGEAFAGLPLSRPYTLPSGDLSLLDRVTAIIPGGGRYGLGLIRAEKDIDPQAWFLTCHFVDDPVMPGTLMYESSLQALRVLLMRMGWIGEADTFAYEPRPGVNSRLRCRGQVKPGTGHAAYEVSIKELGFGPEPYAIADTIMYADGRPIVLVSDISIQLTGLTRADIDRVWSGREAGVSLVGLGTGLGAAAGAASATLEAVPSASGAVETSPDALGGTDAGPDRGIDGGADTGIIGRERILSYTNGSLVHAFGDRYQPFDEGRFIARLPQEPFLFLDRVTRVDSLAWELIKGGEIETEFDIDPDAWYFKANRQPSLPFSVLLEYPLQSCGWFSAYMGSALKSDSDLFYRNLGGRAMLYEDIGRDAGTLTAKIQTTSLSSSAGMLIQSFAMTVFRQGRKVYIGDTSFGFFSKKALAQQVGVRGAAPYEPTREEIESSFSADLKGGRPETPEDAAHLGYDGPGMAATAYRMIDRIEVFAPHGGPHRLGFIRGTKPVNPGDWFFKAHFYQDPVWPGSLGLEAFLQLLKYAAYHHWGDRIAEGYHFEPIATRYEHEWIYRGQVIPTNREVTVEAVITKRDDHGLLLQGSGFLKVDGLVIYEMKKFAIRAVKDRYQMEPQP
jgi:3-hydroxymyristoyl/3-hydroxydecanoyl-(acyl carrier protein) dehydratase